MKSVSISSRTIEKFYSRHVLNPFTHTHTGTPTCTAMYSNNTLQNVGALFPFPLNWQNSLKLSTKRWRRPPGESLNLSISAASQCLNQCSITFINFIQSVGSQSVEQSWAACKCFVNMTYANCWAIFSLSGCNLLPPQTCDINKAGTPPAPISPFAIALQVNNS